jgi:hypothetical protein
MDTISVTWVRSTPCRAFRSAVSFADGWRNMRAETSPAMMVRAWPSSAFWKESVKPRTPVSAATPIATDTITNKNFAGAA